MTAVWVVRASDDIRDLVREKSAVAICFGVGQDLSTSATRSAVLEIVKEAGPGERLRRQAMAASQLYRFVREIQVGDYVLTPLRPTRTVLIGKVKGDYLFNPDLFASTCPHTRPVVWLKEVSRDDFTQPARNMLGGLATVFRADAHLSETETLIAGQGPVPDSEAETEPPFYEEVKAKASEMIRDKLAQLGDYEFQDLVAATLRAMGYVAKLGPRGKDGGVDITAHRDAFGFVDPRIKVQVKHTLKQASRPDLQAFSGTLHQGEFGLFVSSGGFTKEAETWAMQSGKQVTLVDEENLIEMFLTHYEKLDPEIKAFIPLRQVWILTSE